MIGLLTMLGAMFAPSMSISMISVSELTKLRTLWLRGTLGLVTIWLFFHEPWLGCMAAWYLLRWDSMKEHPGLLTWAAIAGSWFLLRSLPPWAWEWIPRAWLAIGVYHVAVIVGRAIRQPSPYQRRALFGIWRAKASEGSPAISALALALVVPFAPVWLLPVFAVGLYVCWSWLSFIGVGVALAVLRPAWAGYIAAALLLVLTLWFTTWKLKRFRIFEHVPRGDSFDSVVNRLIVWALITKAWWAGPRWLGRGPYSLEPELRRWSARCWIELPNGEACCDPLQHLYEYGLVGLCAAGALVLRVGAHWSLADPWSAALLAGAVMSFGHYPFRQPAIGLVVLTCAAGVLR